MDFKLYCVRVFVTDWERSIRFYTETLGMSAAYRSDDVSSRIPIRNMKASESFRA